MRFGIKSVAEVVAERRNVVQEKYTGRGASSRRLAKKLRNDIFFVGGATQVEWSATRTRRVIDKQRIYWYGRVQVAG